jgi:hypothetical protein
MEHPLATSGGLAGDSLDPASKDASTKPPPLRNLRRSEGTDTAGDRFALSTWKPEKADVIWSRNEWTLLCRHLHNGNGPRGFVMGFRDKGEKKYVRSKTKSAEDVISWAWSAIVGKAKSKIAFVPYSRNKRHESRWGAMDFDAHDGNTDRARQFAEAAFLCLLKRPELFVILEGTGSGGFHLWAIAEEFHSASEWSGFLKSIAHKIGATIQSSICEIFPPDSDPTEWGKAVRAPGCWNPSTETYSEILWQNCGLLISSLSGKSKNGALIPKGLQDDFPDRERSISFLPSSSTPQGIYREKEWLEEFSITQPGTRNEMLSALVGEVFHQIGRQSALRLCQLQFEKKTVAARAGLKEHLSSFQELWRGLEKIWLVSLSESERAKFSALTTENERDAFRIIRSYARKAEQDGATDFPIVRDNLAERLGVTDKGAAWIRDKFVLLGITAQTAKYVPNKSSARFKWLLEIPATQNPSQ